MAEELLDKKVPKIEFPDYSAAFYTNVVMKNRHEVVEWVCRVGYNLGFVLKVLKSDLGLGKIKRQRVVFACEQSEVYKRSKAVLKYDTGSQKINCPFKLYAKPSRSGDGWVLNVKCGCHNHKEYESLVGHPFLGRLTIEQHALVVDLTKSGVKPKRIMTTLKERYPGNVTTMKQIYNVRIRYKRDVRHPSTQMQYLLLCLAKEGYDYSHTTFPGSDMVKDIFWVHPDGIALLRNFNLVVIMDNTYKTNRYRVPLLEIVGQTSTCKTFSAAFCFMSAENHASFLWALKQFSGLFADPREFSKVIVTDFDGALVRAITDVFPTSTHLLCQFHVKCNVKGKFKNYFHDMKKTNKVMKAWMDVIHCNSVDEYQAYHDAFANECKEAGCVRLLEYVQRTYLKENKEKFVDAWVHQHMHLGNTTTNRAESAHSTFKRMLADSCRDLASCFETMHNMLICQHHDILESFQKSITRVDHKINIPFYMELRYVVSQEALMLINKEVQRIGYDCDCRIRATHGFPCCCELAGYKKIGRCIPLSAMHVHWQKLSMFDSGQVEPEKTEEEEVDPDPFPLWDEYLKMFNAGDKATKKRLFDKFREVVRPGTTTMIPPNEKVKTKGRKSKKDKSTKRFPSQWERMDSLATEKGESSKKTSKSKSKSKMEKSSKVPLSQPSQPSQTSTARVPTHGFLSPVVLEAYIESVHDVDGDGNCGFRAIALHRYGDQHSWMLVHLDLIKEMTDYKDLYIDLLGNKRYMELFENTNVSNFGAVPKAKWLDLPDMGHAIASMYNMVLVSIASQPASIGQCQTFFPYRTNPTSPPSVWAIGNIRNLHWVQIILRDHCPLPPVYPTWYRSLWPTACEWADKLGDRLNSFKPFLPQTHTFGDVVDLTKP